VTVWSVALGVLTAVGMGFGGSADAEEVPGPASIGVAEATGGASAIRDIAPVRHGLPISSRPAPYERSHHDYPATDFAVPCGTPIDATVDGVVWEVDRVDRWNPATDIAATRGGRTVVIDGDDGVRYLFAHFSTIDSSVVVGKRVSVGDRLGGVGTTGRSTGCHLHLGLSPQCANRVWDRLAGTIWPWPYLDAWRAGENLSPGPEIAAWLLRHPDGCSAGAAIAPVAGVTSGLEPGLGE
jgi:murein DD-endopeptidase MepM/ murein hydrolase activator NlpD